MRQTVIDRSYETNANDPEYSNSFEAVAARVPLTPHRQTKRPRIEGTQVAIVAGPPGEEIHPDKYGRIKLWFPWDRKAKKDGSDTCWVRVAQSWGGGTWGAQIIPRIGMEVMVAFVDGDPDRPLVTGVVPNPANPVPYDLPANKTRMVLRSNTHKGQGFNEITFEDEAGRENQFFHAQKDQTTRVLNDRTKRIDRHEIASIGANRAVEVGGNQKHEIGGSMNTVVGGTGPMAMALMGAVQGLSGHTAGLLSQAGQIAGGGGPALAAFAGTLASSALGFLDAGGLGSREGVVADASPRADAGTALAGSGTGVGDAASGLFPLPGIMNTIVGSFKSDTIGVARAEQIGVSKVTNVGQTSLEKAGKTKKTTVGERYEITVGKAILSQTENHTMIASDKIVLAAPGGIIEINKQGVFIKAKKFEVKANSVNFKRGSGGKNTTKPFAEDCSKK
ncbi:VgrG protein (plasmid) [Sinorhizobium sojae CCBAU 05684]|uniref:VgrG protein n=1 Tax=Sinorhizobium sojae CCBAU 05684 TaxID=716928 RepID=A0A249PLS0_9HYPH|nr:VgrG protein [Sinorhizobium sojae CCBAU 05684]